MAHDRHFESRKIAISRQRFNQSPRTLTGWRKHLFNPLSRLVWVSPSGDPVFRVGVGEGEGGTSRTRPHFSQGSIEILLP